MKKIYLLMFALLGMGLANLYAQVGYIFDSASNGNFAKAFDGDTHTKFEGSNLAGNWIIVKTSDETAQVVKSYAISTHDDGDWNNRAPKTWRLEGSNDKTNWSTIAEVLSGDPIENKNYTTFTFDETSNAQAFTYVKFTMLSMKSTGWTQISEFAVMGVAPAEVDAFRSAMQTKFENKVNAAQEGVMDIFDEMGSSDPLYTEYKAVTDAMPTQLSSCATSYDYNPVATSLALAAELKGIYSTFATGANAAALTGSACWGDGHYSQLIDGKDGVADGKGTKWGGNFSGNEGEPQHVQYIVFRLRESLQPYFYKLVTGGDTKTQKGRNWKDWTVYGGNFATIADAKDINNAGWVALDVRTDISEQYLPMESNYPAALNFTEGVTEPYLYYMVKVTKAHEGGQIQMNEMYLLTQPEFEATRAPLVAYFDDFDSGRDVTDLSLEDKREQFVAKFATLKTTSDPVLMTLTYNELVALRAELEADMDYTQFQDEVTAVDGVYQLGTPAELKLFGKVVNFGHPDLKAALTADIDMSGVKMDPIGTNTVHYTGTFDGQGQTISNYSFSNAGESGVGLFGYIEGATIKNVVLSAANIEGRANAGGLVGNAQNSTVEHNQVIGSTITGYDHVAAIVANAVDNTKVKFNYSNSAVISTQYQAGGVCGTVKAATIEGNLFTGTVSNPNGTAGGLIALIDADDANPTIKNNLVAASTVTGTNTYTIVNTVDRAASFADNFILATTVYSTGAKVVNNKDDQNGCQVSAEEIAGGKFAYVMNGDQSVIAWYQKIGKDPYPVLIGTDIVYNVDGFGYTNSNLDIAKPAVEGGIYMISTPKELLGFSVLVNQGETEAKAQLKNSIDMDGIAWLPIGDDAASAFKGTFDGAGNDITNLVMAASDANGCSSFIGFADAGCTLKNIPLQGSFTGGQYTAGFVGRVVATAAGTISVIDCTNNATVTSSSTQSAGFFGAVQCPTDQLVTFELTNCLNNASISGSNQISGFFGWAKVGDILFTNCDNRGNVTSTGYHVGGFIGRTEKINNDIVASFKNCINYGDVTSPNATSIGGITGRSDVLNSFTDCLNFGDITGAGCVGGLTGNNGATMIRCGNEGRVHGTGSTGELKIGGLFGNGGGACSFTDCYNTGEVVGDAGTISKGTSGSAGGLVGVISASFTMTNCSNSGNVTGYGNNCGGLVGWESSGVAFTIENSWNTGNVSSPDFGENAGGIIGGASGAPTPTIINCYNTGAVTGKINSAGISGWLGSGTPTIQNCWSIGALTNNGGNNTLYRHKSYTAGTITNNYELSGKVATPTNGAPPAGYTADWLANGALTYHINTTAGERIYNQTIGEDATPILDASHGIVNQITAAGYATQYIADTDVTIPAGVKAYTGKVDGAYLKLTEVAEKIPAAAAVVLEGAEGYYSFMPTTGAAAVADNDLVGTATALAADGSQYVLAEKDAVVGFYQATEGTIAAGKAYLTGISAGVKAITFSIADGIASPLSETEEGVIYDLSGRRVEKATKGLYIINGKKVLK